MKSKCLYVHKQETLKMEADNLKIFHRPKFGKLWPGASRT